MRVQRVAGILGLGACIVGIAAGCGPATVPFTASQPADGGTLTGSQADGAVDGGRYDCVEDARFVYAVSGRGDVYRFFPPTLEFTHLGRFTCPGGDNEHVNSVAVDRNGVIWVNEPNATYPLYRVTLSTMACEPIARDYPFRGFGMAFAANVEVGEPDTLYLTPMGVDWLYALDPRTLDMRNVGPLVPQPPGVTEPLTDAGCPVMNPMCAGADGYQGPGIGAELTGTGDGRLYALESGQNPVGIAQVHRDTGLADAAWPVAHTQAGSAFAMAFWGGDFWVFTTSGDTESQITRYHPATGETTLVAPFLGAHIVGAGVSTCVPPV